MPGLALFAIVRRALHVPPSATSREVRIDGLIAAAVGLVVVLGTTLAAMALEKLSGLVELGRALLLLVLVGYGLLVIGGYRALTGRHPASEREDALSSLRRIGIGVAVVVLAFGLLFVLLLGVGAVMGWK
ncbi:MAG TPA: hypothetical protein VGQ83_29480 [Polyangia bacterium]|jgi:hypothetical protein